MLKCPGSSGVLRPTIELLPCPKCGREVEIFTDETRAECECGGVVYRDLNSCIEWCSFAEKCVGEEKYKELKKKL
jgi:hypothetical protein